MVKQTIHIGTSGWSYKDWKGLFYPAELKNTDWLSYYAKTFNNTELNMSFYHLPKKQTTEKWAAVTPDDFLFCVKMSRYITHLKKLHEPEETLEKFFDVFEPMKNKMGPVLIQLPPSLKFEYDLTEHFYKALKEYKGYEFAMEVRHDTWLQEDSLTLMSKYEMAFVISQSGKGFPYAEHVTAKNIYVRFHGPKELYASSYSNEMLKYFATLFKKWQEEKHTIWAFFNNDYFGHAINNALTLQKFL